MQIVLASRYAALAVALSALYAVPAYAQSTSANADTKREDRASSASEPGAPTEASGALEEVVVTAERRENNLQKTAISVSALAGEQVEKTGITSYENLLESIPGVQVQVPTGPTTTPYIAIRGLGTDGDNKPGATAIYLDGIVIGAMGAQLYDLARVEVLRGPQGTLYGGIATGGAVNIISNDPSVTDYSGTAQLEVGDYGLVHAIGVFNAPLSDSAALRVAVNSTRRNPYSDADAELNNQVNARAKLLLKPTDSLSILLGGEVYRLNGVTDDGLQAQDLSGRLIGQYLHTPGYGLASGNKGYANINWDFGFARLVSITAVQKFHSDLSTAPVTGAAETVTPRRDTTTQEFRLTNGADSRLTWVGGLWYKNYQQRDTVNIGAIPVLPADSVVVGPGGVPTNNILISVPELQDNQQYGVFGQLTVPLTDTTRFTAGLRYSKDKIHYDQTLTWEDSAFAPPACFPDPNPCPIPTLFKRNFNSTDWLARVEHDLAPANLVYAMASTGYRPGGPSAPRGSINDPQATYDAERVRAFEIGSKNRFLADRLQLNGAIYYNNYPSFQNELTNYGPNNAQLPSIVPVAAKFYGAELELQTLITPNDRVGASASYIHATYSENASYTDPFTDITTALDTKGGSVPHAPRLQGNVSYDHTFRLTGGSSLVAGANAHYQEKQAVKFDGCLYSAAACALGSTSIEQLMQGSYTLVDASLTFNSASGKFASTLYSRNIGDETIKIQSGRAGLASIAAPRTFGVVFNVKF